MSFFQLFVTLAIFMWLKASIEHTPSKDTCYILIHSIKWHYSTALIKIAMVLLFHISPSPKPCRQTQLIQQKASHHTVLWYLTTPHSEIPGNGFNWVWVAPWAYDIKVLGKRMDYNAKSRQKMQPSITSTDSFRTLSGKYL